MRLTFTAFILLALHFLPQSLAQANSYLTLSKDLNLPKNSWGIILLDTQTMALTANQLPEFDSQSFCWIKTESPVESDQTLTQNTSFLIKGQSTIQSTTVSQIIHHFRRDLPTSTITGRIIYLILDEPSQIEQIGCYSTQGVPDSEALSHFAKVAN